MIGTAVAREGNAHPGLSIPEFNMPKFVRRSCEIAEQGIRGVEKAIQKIKGITEEDVNRALVGSVNLALAAPKKAVKVLYHISQKNLQAFEWCVRLGIVYYLWGIAETPPFAQTVDCIFQLQPLWEETSECSIYITCYKDSVREVPLAPQYMIGKEFGSYYLRTQMPKFLSSPLSQERIPRLSTHH